ncbi:helix-turn-helix domain-containing protein [Winogradskyella haliclonae]|uniref:HTH cro/C1-type domain-containing protein n=1 Tax=Winogradskyella haliclonae TaxID=2048558 RepID=A0ABQ2C153_9FLAO|nr:helix-turn-helix transcriptional regulator [Winogradskyella haliclonae]GGI58476.1 hypothetical protein GCM10011444_27850 [Winogradskyella haliclonae]
MNTKKLNIAEALESIRLERGVNKKEFSRQCGISNTYYSDILNRGTSLNVETLNKICESLEIPLDVFFFKALNEDTIKDPTKKKLIKEIRPLMNEIADLLYN